MVHRTIHDGEQMKTIPASSEFVPGARSSIYGSLEENGRVSQGIKNLLRSGQSWDKMTKGQQETLDQCALKMSRIVTGNDPSYRDHWEDLKGYPEAILKEMPK